MKVSIQVTGGEALSNAFKDVESGMLDLRKLSTWKVVAAEFRTILKEIFAGEGTGSKSGHWAPLSQPYAAYKLRRWGEVPILQASGRMYESLTKRGDKDAVYEETASELTMGTQIPYSRYHQTGTRKMPARKPVDLTEEHTRRLGSVIVRKIRQLATNARLRSLKRG